MTPSATAPSLIHPGLLLDERAGAADSIIPIPRLSTSPQPAADNTDDDIPF